MAGKIRAFKIPACHMTSFQPPFRKNLSCGLTWKRHIYKGILPFAFLRSTHISTPPSINMARMNHSFLPSHEKPTEGVPKMDSPRTAKRKELRAKGPLSWNLKKADQVPRRLAIKNHFVAMVGESRQRLVARVLTLFLSR
jgi:hypothetical protein